MHSASVLLQEFELELQKKAELEREVLQLRHERRLLENPQHFNNNRSCSTCGPYTDDISLQTAPVMNTPSKLSPFNVEHQQQTQETLMDLSSILSSLQDYP